MDQFVLWGKYCENALQKRVPFRDSHLARLATLKEQGILITTLSSPKAHWFKRIARNAYPRNWQTTPTTTPSSERPSEISAIASLAIAVRRNKRFSPNPF